MKPIMLFCLLLIGLSCNSKNEAGLSLMSTSSEERMEKAESDYDTYETADQSYKEQTGEGNSSGPEATPRERKIIQTAHFRFRVEDVATSTEWIKDTIKQYGGYISDLNLSNSSYQTDSEITIRVPVEHFETLLDALSKQAVHIDYRRINASDVTEQFYDMETRLKTKKEVRDRYIEILRTKARTATEILDAEEKIRVVQEEIESVEGRLRYLKNQVALCTINLEMYQLRSDGGSYEVSYASRIGRAFENGWEGLLEFILLLIHSWPFVLMLGLGIWGFRRWRRSRG